MVKQKSQFNLTGNVELYGFPSDKFPTHESILKLNRSEMDLYLVDKGDNDVLELGLDHIKNFLIGVTTTSLLYSGVGSGTTPVTSADTDLETAIGSRLLIQTRYSAGTGIAKFDSFYTAGDNNGSWNESILAPTSSGADAFCRKLLTTTFTKSTSITALLSWTITITKT